MRTCSGPAGTFGNFTSTCIQRCCGAGNESVYSTAWAQADELIRTRTTTARARLTIAPSISKVLRTQPGEFLARGHEHGQIGIGVFQDLEALLVIPGRFVLVSGLRIQTAEHRVRVGGGRVE